MPSHRAHRDRRDSFFFSQKTRRSLWLELFRDDAVDAFSNEANVDDLHIAQVRFGSDVTLQPRPKWFAQDKAEDAKHQRQWDQEESPTGRARALHWHPGHCRGEERCGNQVCPAAWMDRQSTLASPQAGIRLVQPSPQLFCTKLTEDEKAGGIGMSGHVDLMRARQHVECGMFEGVVTPSFENIG
jgi:hypothetical protein